MKENYNNNIFSFLDKFLIENNIEPVKIYNNIFTNETKKNILNDTRNIAGIYLIFNNRTGDYYIGSASTGRFYARFTNHLFYFTGSKIVKHAVKKYNVSSFSFVVLEILPEVINKENNKLLLDLEDFYLKSLLPNYNILTEAGSSFGYKHTEQSRIKMKLNYTEKRRKFIENLNKNKFFSVETINKMKIVALKRGKINYSEQGYLNLKKNYKSITLYNLNKTIFGVYSSIKEAAQKINCSEKTIIRALNTENNILKRLYIVKYTNSIQ